MGMAKPSGGVVPVVGNIGDLNKEGIPNSRYDLYNEQGKLIQSRWYDANGRAAHNRDYEHGNKGGIHPFPHDHEWDWTKIIPRDKNILPVNPDFI